MNNQQLNPFQIMQQARNPRELAKMLKGNEKIMGSEMGKNFVEMLEKGDMSGIAGLGQNISQTIGFTPDILKEKIPAPMRKMLGM